MSFQQQIHKDFIVDYNVKLGSGAFGDVFRGIWKSKNRFVAVKRIKDSISDAKKMMDEEVKVMNQLSHENVLNFLDVIQSEKGTFLIIEFCEGGGLDKEIQQGIPEVDCLKYLKQIVDGMSSVNKALHIHRDLKPENILFTSDKILKICDFGLARRIIGDDPNKLENFSAKGTPLYACPQILRSEPYCGKCDVWSTGVILVEMLTKVNPFSKATNFITLKRLQQKHCEPKGRYNLEGNYSAWFKQIVSKMIAFDQQDRWSFYQLKQKIDKDYNQLLKKYANFSAIKTTPLTKQDLGNAGKTYVEVPSINPDIRGGIRRGPKIISIQTLVPHNPQNTNQMVQMLLTREDNKKLLSQLKVYVQFLYNRGKLFSDVGSKYFQVKENPKQNAYKFLVLFLTIGIFCKNVEKIYELMIKNSSITLPNKTVINYQALDQKSRRDFKGVQTDYEGQMNKQIIKFKTTISQIHAKMTSEKYQNLYKNLLKNYKHLIDLLVKFNNGECKENVEYYQKCFVHFFKNQCLEQNIDKLDEGFVRIYWLCLNIANCDKVLPVTEFENTYIINKIGENSTRLKIQDIKSQIATLTKLI